MQQEVILFSCKPSVVLVPKQQVFSFHPGPMLSPDPSKFSDIASSRYVTVFILFGAAYSPLPSSGRAVPVFISLFGAGSAAPCLQQAGPGPAYMAGRSMEPVPKPNHQF